MKTLGYINDNSPKQLDLESQKKTIEEYCRMNELSLIRILEGGGKGFRDIGLKSLYEEVRKGGVETVVVPALDCLASTISEASRIIRFFDQQGVAFHAVKERIDTESAFGHHFVKILSSFSQANGDIPQKRNDGGREEAVQLISELYHMGHSPRYIGQELEKRGYPAKRRLWRLRDVSEIAKRQRAKLKSAVESD